MNPSPEIMPSVLILPPPAKADRINYVSTVPLAILLVGTVLFLIQRVLLESVNPAKADVWDFVAMGFVLGFAGMLLWVAWSCRTGALPFRFVVDSSKRTCGYRWGSWWTRRTDLSDAAKLRGGESRATSEFPIP
jgi:hypothetical protein